MKIERDLLSLFRQSMPPVFSNRPGLVSVLWVLSLSHSAFAEEVEEKQTIKRTFAFSETTESRQVEVDNFEGSIHVTGYDGREVQLVVNEALEADSQEKAQAARREVRLEITQSNNTIRCYVDGPFRCKNGSINFRGWERYGYKVRYDFELKVPRQTGLRLKTVNGNDIEVEKTSGQAYSDFPVTRPGSSRRPCLGPVPRRVATGQGEGQPHDGRNHCQRSRGQGSHRRGALAQEGIADFEIGFDKTPRRPTVEDGRKDGGKYRIVFDKGVVGSINGGGPEIRFKTLNGNIHIRKGKQ